MMKHLTYKYVLTLSTVCLLVISLFGSCVDSQEETGAEEIIFKLELPPALEVQTRDGTLDGVSISDVWVVQFNASTGTVVKCQNFSGTDIASASSNQTIKVTTSQFSKVESRFYIIANAGTDFLSTTWSGTETQLKALSKTYTLGNYDLRMLTADPITYTPGTTGQVVLVAPLKRAYAKVSLKWAPAAAVKDLIKMTAVYVGNVPRKMALFARGGGNLSTPYPALADVDATQTKVSSGSVLPTNTPCDFYMGENLRGMGTGTSFSEKNLPAKGPSGVLTGCTYIVLKGEYNYSPTTAAINVEYCIYLGGNLMNDYNIQRGTQYDVTINVNGANSADVRVTITDGNVIVFDKVDEINNTVDF